MKANISTLPGIYVHIPFCEQKCGYCDFYSVTDLSAVEPFVAALMQEVERRAETVAPGTVFDTIYFGGGTPSLLSPAKLESILDALRRLFTFAEDTEITLEANPGSVLERNLQAYVGMGVNRLSLGVQSFDDHELAFLGRIHDVAAARRAIEKARRAGFGNLNLDLIHSLPGQTLSRWDENLRAALAYRPEHLSCYNLTIEQGTPFYSLMRKGELQPKPPEAELKFLEKTAEIQAQYGFYAYEISNSARDVSFISRHNYKYWNHTDYLGFGPSAHSLWQKARRANVHSVQKYVNLIEAGKLPVAYREQLDARTEEFEHIFLSLRTAAGIDLKEFKRKFHHSFEEQYQPLIRLLLSEGLMIREDDQIRLTQKGLFISDEILPKFHRS